MWKHQTAMDSNSPQGTLPTLYGQSKGSISRQTHSRALYCLFEWLLALALQLSTRAVETHVTGSDHYTVLEVQPVSPRALLYIVFACRDMPAVRLDSEPVDAC
jgi:hypothetical protein